MPRALRSGYALPTAAAATLVVTATGATLAQSAPLDAGLVTGGLGLFTAPSGSGDSVMDERIRAQAAAALADREGVAERRREASISQVAAEGRAAEARASRAAERAAAEAAAKAQAEAEAEALARARQWVAPTDAPVSSSFGWRWGRLHAGMDFAASYGAPLHSMSTGEVIFAGWGGGYGYKVEIRYWDGTVSYFGHMSEIGVYVGQQVSPGDYVGKVGSTGVSTGPHLHLEIHPDGGSAINPYSWLVERALL